jgi:O-antigen/teichoic acid export membrane protein
LYLLNGHALYAVGQQQRVSVAMAAVTAIKLLLDALIVPRWSAWGAAGAALAVEALLFGWLQYLVWQSVLRPAMSRGREDLAPADESKGGAGFDVG